MTAPVASPPPLVFDTGALMTLAVHDDLWAFVRTQFNGRATVTNVVRGELNGVRGGQDHRAAKLAKRAHRDFSWQGTPALLSGDSERNKVEEIRRRLAVGGDGGEKAHLGEATCIVHAKAIGGHLIIEDYSARVVACDLGVLAISVHVLLHKLFRASLIELDQAMEYIVSIYEAGRGPLISRDDFVKGPRFMGRVGLP